MGGSFSVAVKFSDGDASGFRGTIAIGFTKILSGASSTYDTSSLSAFGDGSKSTLATIFGSEVAGSSLVGMPKLIFSAKRPPIQIRQPSPNQTVLNITPYTHKI
jgi:hypothetical protein